MESTLERVLVVIPCLNEHRTLHGVLAGILDDASSDSFLVVVVDGGSTDGTREFAAASSAREHRVVLLDNPRRVQSAGINLAVEQLGDGCKWMVRVDAHADYPPNYVSDLVAAAQRTRAASVVVPMVTQGQTCFQRAAAAAQNSRLGSGGAPHRRKAAGGWVDHGHHALFDLQAFIEIGGYDESFAANEDAELDVRLGTAGHRIWLADDIVITYHPRAAPWPLFRQYLNYGAGRARTLLRHLVRPKLRQLAPVAVAPAVLLLVPAVVFPPAAFPAVLWATISLGYGAWLGIKARDACAALSGIAALVMHLGWSLGFWSRIVRGPGARFDRKARWRKGAQ